MAKKPKCAVCAGHAPFAVDALEERQCIQEEEIWFKYPGRVQTHTLNSFVGGTTVVAQARRLTDSRSEIVIELHDCFDEGRLVFQVRGPLPVTASEKNALTPETTAAMLAQAGFSFIPIKIDGSKAPLIEWKKYQLENSDL